MFWTAWPGLVVMAVCAASHLYGRRRRNRSGSVTLSERLWVALAVPAFVFPAFAAPWIWRSPAMNLDDRIKATLVSVGLGFLPLSLAMAFWVPMRLVRRYEARAKAGKQVPTSGA